MGSEMSRTLNDIHPKAQPKIFELLARAAEAQLPLMIIFTGRTPEQQEQLYAIGRTDGQPASKQVTWTMDSKHVMSPKQHMKSLAIDVCPYELYTLAPGNDKLQWDPKNYAWSKLGEIGQALGLKWGVVDANGTRKDVGHFEYVGPII